MCTVYRSCISIVCTKQYLNLHGRKVRNLAGNVQLKIKSQFMEPSFLILTKLSAVCVSQHLIYLIYVNLIKELCLKKHSSSQKKRNVIIYILQHINTGRQDLLVCDHLSVIPVSHIPCAVGITSSGLWCDLRFSRL